MAVSALNQMGHEPHALLAHLQSQLSRVRCHAPNPAAHGVRPLGGTRTVTGACAVVWGWGGSRAAQHQIRPLRGIVCSGVVAAGADVGDPGASGPTPSGLVAAPPSGVLSPPYQLFTSC
jgi:hypothetical protein